MRKARWLAPWKDSAARPSIYHCVTRVVGRDFVFGSPAPAKGVLWSARDLRVRV